jgi:hypothetical protein
MYSVVKSMKNKYPRIYGGYYSRCSDHPARRRGIELLLWETRSQASMQNSCVADPGSGAFFLPLDPGSGMDKKSGSGPDHISESIETNFCG